jgi:dihydroxyacetone kinase-like predicted kinase
MTRRSGDGAGLLGALRAAVDNLAEHVDEVNALNVFPVPDGDTGSNMLATVRAALAEAEAVKGQPADRIAAAVSYGALMGARGNSGVIASQIFRGMAEAMGGRNRFYGSDLARCLAGGTTTAYKAVVKPVEGTILTVIREASAAAVAAAEKDDDLEVVLAAAVKASEEAVARTQWMLPVLEEAGVVDAGGQGLYRLLEGALRFMQARDRRFSRWAAASAEGEPARAATAPDEFYGYETMFLLHSREKPLDVDHLRTRLEQMGDSVLVAGDTRAVKVHVHNNRPDEVIALGLSMGALTRITVENLDAQSADVRDKKEAERSVGRLTAHAAGHPRHGHEGRPHVDPAMFGEEPAAASDGAGAAARAAAQAVAPVHAGSAGGGSNGSHGREQDKAALAGAAPMAVVAVAAGDGLARIFDSFGVAAVVRGGQSANPSTGELLDAVERIRADEILLLPNNPNVVLAARQAAELANRRVRVVPTRNAAEGFAALLAMDAARDATANAELMTLAGRAVQTLQVTEAVRDAVVGGHKVKLGQTIVLDPDDGLLAVSSDRMKAVLTALKALEPGFELVTIYYGEGVEVEEAAEVADKIGKANPGVEAEVIHGGQPHYRYLIAAE